MKSLLASEDSTMLHRIRVQLDEQRQALDKVLQSANDVDGYTVKSMDDLQSIVKDVSFIHEQLTADIETPSFLGFKMKRKEFLDKLELPDLSDVKEVVEELQIRIYDYSPFSIVRGKMAVSKKAQEAEEMRARLYTESNIEADLITKYREAASAMTNLLKAMNTAGVRSMIDKNGGLYRDEGTKLKDVFNYNESKFYDDSEFTKQMIRLSRRREQQNG